MKKYLLIFALLLSLTTFAQQKTNSFINHENFTIDENFVEANGTAMWFNMTESGYEHCTFTVNVTDPYNYIFVYYENGYPMIAFSTFLIENGEGGWKFNIRDHFTSEKIHCNNIQVYYIDSNSIEIFFSECKNSKILFKSVILSKDFSHLD